MRRALPVLLALTALFLAACGDDGAKTSDAGAGGDTAAQDATAPQETQAQQGGCKQVDQPAAKKDGGQKKPSGELDRKYVVTVLTSCGEFAFTLHPRTAPKTGKSFVALADAGFFGRTFFHRIVPGFVIQGGDPTGTGTGGPGYKTVDKPPSSTKYTKGVVAMAKGGAEAPGTAGSQFFVVTGDDAGLPPEYAVVGKITEGMDVVERIGALGDASEQPTQPVVIEKLTAKPS